MLEDPFAWGMGIVMIVALAEAGAYFSSSSAYLRAAARWPLRRIQELPCVPDPRRLGDFRGSGDHVRYWRDGEEILFRKRFQNRSVMVCGRVAFDASGAARVHVGLSPGLTPALVPLLMLLHAREDGIFAVVAVLALGLAVTHLALAVNTARTELLPELSRALTDRLEAS